MKEKNRGTPPLCECECGERVKNHRSKYVSGHNPYFIKNKLKNLGLDIPTIQGWYAGGLTIRKIAKKIGVPNGSLYNFMARNNIPLRSYARKRQLTEGVYCEKIHAGYVFVWIGGLSPEDQELISSMKLRDKVWIQRSRLVKAKELGRPLSNRENVHHWNGIKDDDRPENLGIFTSKEHAQLIPRYRMHIRKLELEVERLTLLRAFNL